MRNNVTIDISVEKATMELARFSSFLYFMAKIPVIAAEGIAFIMNITNIEILGMLGNRRNKSTNAGIINKRNAVTI